MPDKGNGEIIHLLMREGHLWGKMEASMPAFAIDSFDSQVVDLRLDREEIKDLPAVPVKRC